MHSHWVQFYAHAQKIRQSPFVIITPTPDSKWGWSVDNVILGRDSPENLRILKRHQLGLDH